jgi:Plasma-membrane choline transporter
VEVQAVDNSCVFVSPSYTTGMVFYISLAYLWSVLLFATMRLSIIANIIGSWHFHPEKTASLGRAIVNSCTTSMGTLAVASLISTIAEKLNRMFAKERLVTNCFNPIFWVVLPLYLVFGSCLQLLIQMLTKFSVILHVFTGKSWMGSAKKVAKIMKRHFLGGFVTATSSSSVLNLGCYVFSIGIYFIGWVWLDKAFHTSTFIGISDEKLFAVGWLFFALFNIYYPVLGVYFIILLNRWLSSSSIRPDPAIWLTPLAAAFIGCISMMFFNYLAGTFMDTVDVQFLCFAIDRDNKKDLQEDEFAKLVFEGMPNVLVEPAVEEAEKGNDQESGIPVAVASIEAPSN